MENGGVEVAGALAAARAAFAREHVAAVGARAHERSHWPLASGLWGKPLPEPKGKRLEAHWPGIMMWAPVVPASISHMVPVDGLSGIFIDAAVAFGTAMVTCARALA